MRLAAIQDTLLRAAARFDLHQVLTVHGRLAEAKAFAHTMADAGNRATGPAQEAVQDAMVPRWLSGEHEPKERRGFSMMGRELGLPARTGPPAADQRLAVQGLLVS
jgi:hypothetical protein